MRRTSLGSLYKRGSRLRCIIYSILDHQTASTRRLGCIERYGDCIDISSLTIYVVVGGFVLN